MRKVTLWVALVLLAACSSNIEDVSKNLKTADVKASIDAKLGAYLRTYDASLSVGRAQCPDQLDLYHRKVVYCTVAINGDAIPVRITYKSPPQFFDLNFDGALFEMQRVEKVYQRDLADHGHTPHVDCGKPRIRVYKPGASFTCAVSGDSDLTSLRIVVDDSGGTSHSLGLKGSESFTFSRELANHQHHLPVVIDGNRIASWDSASIREQALASGRKLHPFSISCPPQVDLSGARRSHCALSIDGMIIHREVWIDDSAGIKSQAMEAVVPFANAERFMQAEMNRQLREGGREPNASVQCNHGAAAIAIGGTFHCTATALGSHYQLKAIVTDVQGHYKFTIDPVDSAEPRSTGR